MDEIFKTLEENIINTPKNLKHHIKEAKDALEALYAKNNASLYYNLIIQSNTMECE
jgi:hypothetical protein